MFSLKVGSEKSTLIFSALVSGFFALSGIFWGVWTGSLAILFDGAYSFVSLALSLLSVQALKWSESPANTHFNFGCILAEPMVIAIKGIVISLVCVVSLMSALNALVTGGREVMAGMAMMFAFFSLVSCIVTWCYLKRANTVHHSALLDAETKQWCMDSFLSGVVLLGFVIAWGLAKTKYAYLSVYADPILVVLASVYFMLVPLRMALQAAREIMMISPKPEMRQTVYRALEEINIQPSQCKMAKIGSYLLLEISIGVERVEQMEGMQQTIEVQLQAIPLEVRLHVMFYSKWQNPVSQKAAHA